MHEQHAEHHGTTVTVLRRLTLDEADPEVGPMFRVRFSDGTESAAFGDELDQWRAGVTS
jgi:hypothetical protein